MNQAYHDAIVNFRFSIVQYRSPITDKRLLRELGVQALLFIDYVMAIGPNVLELLDRSAWLSNCQLLHLRGR
jgi:hypothetical protein